MSLRLVTAASGFPVTTGEAKEQCRVLHDDEDTYIDGLISAATAYVEQYLGMAIGSQTWEKVLDKFSDTMLLPKGPVTSVTSIKYNDIAGAEQTLSATVYKADTVSIPARVTRAIGQSWPETDGNVNAVTIRFVCGYSTVPGPIKQAILLLISTWFDHRQTVATASAMELPHSVTALLANYRNFATTDA